MENVAHQEEQKRPHQFQVTVLYNGVPKKFEVRRDELVQQLLDRAGRRSVLSTTPISSGSSRRRGSNSRTTKPSKRQG